VNVDNIRTTRFNKPAAWFEDALPRR